VLDTLVRRGARSATIRFSVEDVEQALSGVLRSMEAAVRDGTPVPADATRRFRDLARSPWRLDGIQLDGRVLSEPDEPWSSAHALGMLVLGLRFGRLWERLAMSGSDGFLEVDLRRATASVVHRRESWRLREAEHVVLRPRDRH